MTINGGQTNGDNIDSNDNTFSGGAIRSVASGSLTIENGAITGNLFLVVEVFLRQILRLWEA